MRTEFCGVTENLIEAVSAGMRSADRAECYRLGFGAPIDALRGSVEASALSLAALFDGQPAAIFGVRETAVNGALGPAVAGVCWALTTTVVDRNPFAYMRQSRACLAALLDFCPQLEAHIDARYPQALRWAAWLGFTLGEPVGHGPYGLAFVRAVIRRH